MRFSRLLKKNFIRVFEPFLSAPILYVSYKRWLKKKKYDPLILFGSVAYLENWLNIFVSFVSQSDTRKIIKTIKSFSSNRTPGSFLHIGVSCSLNTKCLSRVLDYISTNKVSHVNIIKLSKLTKAEILQELLSQSASDYFFVLDVGDQLSDFSIVKIYQMLIKNKFNPDVVYTDEDKISRLGKRFSPYFKPEWSPELLLSFNYFGRCTIIKTKFAKKTGGFNVEMRGAAEWDLNLRMAEKTNNVFRLPEVLCHKHALCKKEKYVLIYQEAEKNNEALRESWKRRGFNADVIALKDGVHHSIVDVKDQPFISIVIPTKDKPDLIKNCVNGILNKTDYQRKEIIIVDTGSSDSETIAFYDSLQSIAFVKIVYFKHKFNYSAVCNYGASFASGDFFLFLNNDIEIENQRWLLELVLYGMQPGVGVVGTKLLYPNGDLQHGGVILVKGMSHFFPKKRFSRWSVFGSPEHVRNYSAVTGAVHLINRKVFNRVNGYDERFEIAYSDITFCLSVLLAGYRIVYNPFAWLYHHEGATRGKTHPHKDTLKSAEELYNLGFFEDRFFHPELIRVRFFLRFRFNRCDLASEQKLYVSNILNELNSDYRNVFNLHCDGFLAEKTGLKREELLWKPQLASDISDVWGAARYCIDLLRSRNDFREKFPLALSLGEGSPFLSWIVSYGSSEFDIPAEKIKYFFSVFAKEIHSQAKILVNRIEHDMGDLSSGNHDLLVWLLTEGVRKCFLRKEEIWWLYLAMNEEENAISSMSLGLQK